MYCQDIDDFFRLISKYQKSTWWKFRGQSDSKWELIPKAGREPYRKYPDEAMFNNWRSRAIAYIDKSDLDIWSLLAIAQHTGLPTRFLDWSHNPLIAAFFACIENTNSDGVIYAYNSQMQQIDHDNFTPFTVKEIGIYFPKSISHRIINQAGYFTVHPNPKVPMTLNNCGGTLEKIIINKYLKNDIIFRLYHYDITYKSIFPDLEGLSKAFCWFCENIDYWSDNSIFETDISSSSINKS